MSTPNPIDPKVKQTLEDLHKQLDDAQVTSPANQEHLSNVKQSIRATLDESPEVHGSALVERLEEVAVVFNTDHPDLSNALRVAVDILVGAGF